MIKCTNKKRYKTVEDIERAIKKKKKKGLYKDPLTFYRCEHCRGFHLTKDHWAAALKYGGVLANYQI